MHAKGLREVILGRAQSDPGGYIFSRRLLAEGGPAMARMAARYEELGVPVDVVQEGGEAEEEHAIAPTEEGEVERDLIAFNVDRLGATSLIDRPRL